MKKISFLILVIVYLFLVSPKALAQHFTSASYIIDWGNFNITSGKKVSTNYSLTDTVGQNAPGPYQSAGYKVKSGFQYIYETFNQLSFVIDNLDINLGTLTAGVASTATNIITISTPSGHGYQILTQYNHPLALTSGTTIPDTRCDLGNCTATSAKTWTSASIYGFGYNVIGINTSGVATNIGTSGYFGSSTAYRPFSSTGKVAMSETVPVQNHSARVSYKTNISTTQAAGSYQSAIIFTAVPNY
ncbi:MAG: hypothetical protein WC851_01265 [Candidatus Shapirobacteria bacterium]|jgi:hypothetical protein